MTLMGHKPHATFDRYNIVHEEELLTAGQRLAESAARRLIAELAQGTSDSVTTMPAWRQTARKL
jgi:hypothetical protein